MDAQDSYELSSLSSSSSGGNVSLPATTVVLPGQSAEAETDLIKSNNLREQMSNLSALSRSDPSFGVNFRQGLRRPVDIIQGHMVKEKAKDIQSDMAKLEQITAELREMSNTADTPIEKQFLDTVLRIKASIQAIYSFVDLILIERMSAKKRAFLRSLRGRPNPAQDIR